LYQLSPTYITEKHQRLPNPPPNKVKLTFSQRLPGPILVKTKRAIIADDDDGDDGDDGESGSSG
jgi:hypothetical protein